MGTRARYSSRMAEESRSISSIISEIHSDKRGFVIRIETRSKKSSEISFRSQNRILKTILGLVRSVSMYLILIHHVSGDSFEKGRLN